MGVNLYDLAPFISVDAPGCPDVVAARALIEATREFCQDTLAWLVKDTITLDGSIEYTPTVPAESSIVDVRRAVMSRRSGSDYGQYTRGVYEIKKVGQYELTGERLTGSTPQVISHIGDNTLHIEPANSGEVELLLAIKPTLTAEEIDEFIVNEFEDTLRCGTLARLFAMPNRSWSNLEYALYKRREFDQYKAEARRRASDGFMVGTPRSVRYGGV